MRRLWVAVLACVLVSLAACSDGEPKAAPNSSVTPSATESVSVVPKDESAEDFIRRWFGTQQAIYDRGDATEYLAMSPDCEDCRAGAKRLTDIHEAGGTIDFAGGEVTKIRATNKKRHLYVVTFKIGPTVYRESADGPEQRLAGGVESFSISLQRRGETWVVATLLRRVNE